jgi:hypothetical protein
LAYVIGDISSSIEEGCDKSASYKNRAIRQLPSLSRNLSAKNSYGDKQAGVNVFMVEDALMSMSQVD